MATYNQDLLNAMEIAAFVIGLANYNENLTQSDKDDIMRRLDQQTQDILERVEKALNEQNAMLEEILKRVRADE